MSATPARHRSAGALIGITLAWLISRLPAFFNALPEYEWDIWEPRKLLEYGFWRRGGALINVHYMAGQVSNPEVFNYVDHPYPIFWLYTLIYRFFAGWGITVFVAAMGLLGCWLTYFVLARLFAPKIAFFGALLYTLAPSCIFYSINPDVVALAIVMWPAAALVLLRAKEVEIPLTIA